MIKRNVKNITVTLPNGEIFESCAPIGLLSAMIQRGMISAGDAEDGKINLPDSCTFASEILFSEADAKKRYVYIEVSGVLGEGEFFLNGKSCGVINNPQRTYLFDVADKVVPGNNIAEIRCSEPFVPKQMLNRYGERASEYDNAICVADYGVLNPISVYVSDCAFINGVRVRQEHNDGKVSVFVSAETIGDKDDVRIVASLSAPSGKIYFGGAYEKEIKISVADPELWWPKGYGAQPIYKLTVTLYHGAEVADVYEKRVGLRKAEVLHSENSVPALYVNGVKVFSRGATYVKQNAVFTSISNESIEFIVKSATKANMNTLTVFDEAAPLPEHFYDLCDKLGIMVWQSVTLPYIAPPAASVFAAGVSAAIEDSVKRLSLHPSVAMFFFSFVETNKQMMRLFKDSIEEFRSVSSRILDPVFKKCASDVPFVADPHDIFKHDESYLFEKDAGYAYRTLYALPSEYTLKNYLDEKNYNLFSYESERRTNVPKCLLMLENTVKHMKMPTGMSELVYASEVAAGYESAQSVKRARRSGICYSAVLRQLNDGKKTVSGSFIDYFGKHKATMKFISEAYAPITVDVVPCVNETEFWVINSTKRNVSGKLIYALYDTCGKCYTEKHLELSLGAGECVEAEKVDFSRYVGENADMYYVTYELYDEKGIVATGSEHFVPIKHVQFADPKITAEISGMGKRFSVKLTSDTYAYSVKVDFDDLNVNFSSNFVNLYGKTPVVIDFETAEVVTLGELQNKIKIYSPYSIGK